MQDTNPTHQLTSSCVFISDIRLHAYHGVLPQERVVGNDYTVSVRAGYDVSRAMLTDDVADTLDYSAVLQVVKGEMAKPSRLVEHVAARVAQRLFDSFPDIRSLDISITKLNPPMGADCAGAGIELHLTNNKTK